MWSKLNASGSGPLLSGVASSGEAATQDLWMDEDEECKESQAAQRLLEEEEDGFNWLEMEHDGSDDDKPDKKSDLDYKEAFGCDLSVESELLLPQKQCHRNSWVWKTYIFVLFMVAFTKLSQECATLILLFVFSVIAPLVEQTRHPMANEGQVHAKDRLVVAC